MLGKLEIHMLFINVKFYNETVISNVGFFYSFYFESERGLFPNTEYVYDLELPLDFVPKNADGEVETFELLTAEECIQRALSPHFKTTSAPVLLDFLIRKGYINPENGR